MWLISIVVFVRGRPAPAFARHAVFAALASTALLMTPKLAVALAGAK